MARAKRIPLTYSAYLRQLFAKNELLVTRDVPILPRISRIKPNKKLGTSRKAIVTTGIVRVAAWEEQNRNTGEWSTVVEYWRKIIPCISSQLLVVERK